MFWKRIVDIAIDPEELTSVTEAASAPVDWMRTKTAEEFAQTFHLMATAVDALHSGQRMANKNVSAHAKAVEILDSIRTLWFQVDWQLATFAHATTLFHIITDSLPSAVHNFQVVATEEDLSFAWAGYDISVSSYVMNQKRGRSFRTEAQTILDLLKQVQLEQKADEFSMMKNVTPVTYSYVFPKLVTVDALIVAAVESLSDAWNSAKTRASSIEDKYFVEQVAISYVPDAWKMFNNFGSSSVNQAEAAKKILIEQFTLMENKLNEIVEASSEVSLMTMRAQLDFLKTKTHSHESSLNLPKR